MSYTDEKIARIFLNMVPQVGPQRFEALVQAFGTAQAVLQSPADEIARVVGTSGNCAAAIHNFLKHTEILDRELNYAEQHDIHVIVCGEPEYPELLTHIWSPPPVLYCRGKNFPLPGTHVGMVGTRRPSQYGRQMSRMLAGDLAERGLVTVSGGARGIDTEIHEATLKAKGSTVAVLGCGLSVCYPPENRKLFDRIAQSGACISEFSCATGPDKRNFPQRNRIISGMSSATVVIEAGLKSGALITARCAAEQGRDVMTVPGTMMNTQSFGNHWLLRQGAHPVLSADEVLEDIFPFSLAVQVTSHADTEAADLNEEERRVVASIGRNSTSIDTLIEHTRMNIGALMKVLLDLKIKGCVEELPGKLFMCSLKGIRSI